MRLHSWIDDVKQLRFTKKTMAHVTLNLIVIESCSCADGALSANLQMWNLIQMN